MRNKIKKIRLGNKRAVMINKLFKAKERFHRALSKLPFEEKIGILIKMKKIVQLQRAR